jgi:hypothetical protein
MATDLADANRRTVVRLESSIGGNAGDADKNLPQQHTDQSNAIGEVQFEERCEERCESNTTNKTNPKTRAASSNLSTAKCYKPVAIMPKLPDQSVGIEVIQPEQRFDPAEKLSSFLLIPVQLTVPTAVESVSTVSGTFASSS